MSNAIIRAYMEGKIATWAAAQSPAIPVAYEDVPFTPPATGHYLEVFLMPAATLTATIKGTRGRMIGLFQINLYTRAGQGSGPSETLAQSIIAAFPCVPKVGDVSIENIPYATQIEQEISGFKITSITVNYRYESS